MSPAVEAGFDRPVDDLARMRRLIERAKAMLDELEPNRAVSHEQDLIRGWRISSDFAGCVFLFGRVAVVDETLPPNSLVAVSHRDLLEMSSETFRRFNSAVIA